MICILSYYLSVSGFFTEAKWVEGAFLNSLSFGYVTFICVSAILVGALNCKGSFFENIPPVILNFFMISAMIVGKFFFGFSHELQYFLFLALFLQV